MIAVAPVKAHRLWAATYDSGLNPLLALEARVLDSKLGPLRGLRILDVASGTGRWMARAQARGANVAGIDLCPEMLFVAARKPSLRGRNAIAEAAALPIADEVADITLCSFALSYFPSAFEAIQEMARVTRPGGRVVIADLHPEAERAGWKRSFRDADQVYEIDHEKRSIADVEVAAERSGLALDWRCDAHFGEPERDIFQRAGKAAAFPEHCRLPAVIALAWTKQ
ncbi:MAG TPA: methyltransferase domain-containing protein [Bryobacteraceae bacterium]|nr:methyltransferase domain-containing protein [Bryobacteraceae bacterium]